MEIIKQKIGYYRDVCAFSEIRELVNDVVVPDTNPDFESAMSVFAVCTIDEKSLVSGGIKTSGTVDTTIYYDSSASESAYLLQNSFPFVLNFEENETTSEDKLILSVKVVETLCEIINSRKVRLKVKLLSSVQVLRKDELCLCGEIINGEQDGINCLTEKTEVTLCSDINEKQFGFFEEIRPSENDIPLNGRIIRWNGFWSAGEVKKMQNKVMIRGGAEINVYFADEAFKNVSRRTYTVPFTQIVECSAEENDFVSVDIKQVKCNLNKVIKDDGIFLECDMTASASVMVFRKTEADLLTDAYSTFYLTEPVTEKVNISGEITDFRKECEIEGRFSVSDGVSGIIDYSVSGCIISCDGSIRANYFATLLYENVMGKIKCTSIRLSSEAKKEKGIIPSSCFAEAEKINVRIDATGAVISFIGLINAKKQSCSMREQVQDLKIDKKAKRNSNMKGNLILKRSDKNESIWDIAKKFGTTKSAILSANEAVIGNDSAEGNLIIIPFVR